LHLPMQPAEEGRRPDEGKSGSRPGRASRRAATGPRTSLPSAPRRRAGPAAGDVRARARRPT